MGTQNKAQIDKLLTEASNGYFPASHIADMIFPVLRKTQTSGKLGKYGNDHLRIVNTLVNGEGKYRRVRPITKSTQSYYIEGHGLTDLVTEEDFNNTDKPFDARKDTTIGLTQLLKVEKEYAVASVLTNTSVLTQNITLSGTSQWSDYDNSDPISNIRTGQNAILDGSGMAANVAIMDQKVFNTIQYHPELLAKLGFSANRAGILSKDDIASALNVERVLVSAVRYNSAKEGQTDVLSAVWGKSLVMAYIPTQAVPRQQSLGYDVRHPGTDYKVYKWNENNPPNSESVLVENPYDILLSNVGCAYLIKDIIA